MKSRVAWAVLGAAAALFLLGGVCSRKLYPPEFVEVPHSVYAGDTAWVRLVTSGRGYDSVRYVVNWDDSTTDTTLPLGLLDTANVWHIYAAAPDTKYVRAAVYAPDDVHGIRWAAYEPVVVVEPGGSHAPVVDSVLHPPVVVRGVTTWFTVYAHDPDGDSIRAILVWNDSTDTTTGFSASPSSITVPHVFTKVETAVVAIYVQDTRGALSLSDTIFVPVGTAGGVKWYRLGLCWTSPLVASDGSEECIYCSVEEHPEDTPIFRALGVAGGVKHTFGGTAALVDEPAFSTATEHIIIGGDGGEFHALTEHLDEAWEWPTGSWQRWRSMAVNASQLYLQSDSDSLYCFVDSLSHGVRVATFPAQSDIVDAPVVDSDGDIYFGTDSGYLYKVGPNLDTLCWRTRLIASGEIHSPIIGSAGNIYCASESSRINAIDAATGVPLWTMATEGEPLRLAMGQTAIFVGTDLGAVYSLNPGTGSIIWQRSFGQGVAFTTTPIVAANGYVYFQSDNDVLYCLNQPDGTLVWSCDCSSYLPGGGRSGPPRPREAALTDYDPNPTITSTGDIIVPGQAALFCVAGYPAGPLDPLAPWPKWQHDLHNTGCLSGGR